MLPLLGATLDAFRSGTASATKRSPPTPATAGRVPGSPARAHVRVEDRIRTSKDTGLGRLPSRHQSSDAVWVELALIAADLLVLTQSDCSPTKGPGPRRAQDAALPAAAHRHPDHPRPAKVFRRLAEHWPWTLALTSAFLRLRLIPLPA
jgi:hypothetical protein